MQLNETTLSVVPEACTIADACTVPQSVNAGYKIVFDNIDKTIKPRHMTADSQTTSLQAQLTRQLTLMCITLGVLAKNETKYDDMIDILEEYKKYIPSSSVTLQEPIPESNVTEDKSYVTTLVGGDYLSVARDRGAQLIREMHRLNGMLPVAEDWHAKVCLLEVIYLHNDHLTMSMRPFN